jgi:hypothetical protein
MGMTADEVHWVRVWPDDGQPEFRIGRLGDDLVAEWVGFATLRSNRAGTLSEYNVEKQGVNPEIADKFQRGQVRGLLRHLQGLLSFHGSAAALDGKAVLLLGDSSAGKSSTAAALCSLRSAEFIADDTAPVAISPTGIWIDRIDGDHWLPSETTTALGLGSYPGRWKQRFAPRTLTQGAVPLVVVIKLEFDDRAAAPSLRQLAGREVFQALTTSVIRFVLDEADVALRDFEQLTALATRTPVFELRRPRGVEGLARNASLIHELVETCSRPTHGGGA